MSRAAPTREQTLRALAKVSRREVWDGKPQTSTWQAIGAAAVEAIHQALKAAA